MQRILIAAKLNRARFDPSGAFSSHLRRVPRGFLDEHPALWTLPVTFAAWVHRWPHVSDQPLLVAIGMRLVEVALQDRPERNPERVRRSTL